MTPIISRYRDRDLTELVSRLVLVLDADLLR